ncbi:hypothetical protein BDV95DRAFT_540162 [Massariosphaeria phaeospora]|uniref:Uncharacterized protein n=1 Tax=Massariosphaeria phaeospora TaxID=100035 RepID=A0A7C8IAB8_9PLEO|nr:hypothetical protein BDV95DRAFT_540162 [Massariosphaeria phaeospora]
MARRRAQTPDHAESSQGRLRKRKDGDEYGDAKTDSQQLLALRPLLQEPKPEATEMRDFRTMVEGNQRDLRSRLQQRVDQTKEESRRRRNEIASRISESLQRPPPYNVADRQHITYPGTQISMNPLISTASSILYASDAAVSEYKRLEQIITTTAQDREQPITQMWEQEVQETERLIRLGHNSALRNVKKVLGADDGNGNMEEGAKHEAGAGGDGEQEEMALNYELERTLRYAERGVKRLVKGLPADEVDN